MSYSIIRMQKIKATGVRGIQFHNQRERESETNPDIDKSKNELNYDLLNDKQIDYVATINERIQEGVESDKKIRKDAVRLCEFLVTSDKEFFSNLSEGSEKRFFEKAHEFLADKYGAENIIYATVHKDEKTPHMHVGFVPITEDKKLSAKQFFGQRLQLVQLQNEFNQHMKEAGYDLDRGISSDKKHLETAKFKAVTLDKQVKELEGQTKVLEAKVTELESQQRSREALIQAQRSELEQNKSELEKTSRTLTELKENLAKVEAPLKQLDEIQPKTSAWSNKVSMTKEEYQVVEGWAKKGMQQDKNSKAMQGEIAKLRTENTSLKSDNQELSRKYEVVRNQAEKHRQSSLQLSRENQKLTKENTKFKALYEFAKEKIEQLGVWDRLKELFNKKEKELDRSLSLKREQELER